MGEGRDATALVTNVQRFSIHDGGGIRTVCFLKGCPFRCPWCCNPENLSFEPQVSWNRRLCIHCSMAKGADGLTNCPCTPQECPTAAKALLGTRTTVRELLAAVERDRTFYEESNGGVTLSGGECLSGPNQGFSMEFLEACKEAGLGTAVESTLAMTLHDPARLTAACDQFLVDFKIADRERSVEVTGIDPAVRDRNVGEVVSEGGMVIARLPIIPGFTDAADNVLANARRARELGITRADVLPFHQLGEGKYESLDMRYELRGTRQLSEGDVEGVVAACEGEGLKVVVHGE